MSKAQRCQVCGKYRVNIQVHVLARTVVLAGRIVNAGDLVDACPACVERVELVDKLVRFNPFGGYCVEPCKHGGHTTDAYRRTVAKYEGRRKTVTFVNPETDETTTSYIELEP